MTISPIKLPDDLPAVQHIAERSFSFTNDASLQEWFSFEEMAKQIQEGRGICLKAVEDDKVIGTIYAQQESPINGAEGTEKWVIVIAAVHCETTGKGIGSQLLAELEVQVKQRGAMKLFVYTNKGDERVIHFYQKNGYEDAGGIRDYQYGKGNSAVFLMKWV